MSARRSTVERNGALNIERLVLATDTFALDVRDLHFAAGVRTGIVGANGCGKTTLLEAALGVRTAKAADISILGVPLAQFSKDAGARKRVGFYLQASSFSMFVKVREVLDLHAAMYGASCKELYRALQLDELIGLRARLLSRGQLQRLHLFLALAHRPRLVLLDEPIAGLDRRFIEVAHAAMLEQTSAGAALVIVGHTEDEFALMERVVWMTRGTVTDHDEPRRLIGRHLGEFRFRCTAHSSAQADDVYRRLRTLAGLRKLIRTSSVTLLGFGDLGFKREAASFAANGDFAASELASTTLGDLVRLPYLDDPPGVH